MDLADLSMNQIVEPTSDIVENKEVELKEELVVKVEMNVEMKETVKINSVCCLGVHHADSNTPD